MPPVSKILPRRWQIARELRQLPKLLRSHLRKSHHQAVAKFTCLENKDVNCEQLRPLRSKNLLKPQAASQSPTMLICKEMRVRLQARSLRKRKSIRPQKRPRICRLKVDSQKTKMIQT